MRSAPMRSRRNAAEVVSPPGDLWVSRRALLGALPASALGLGFCAVASAAAQIPDIETVPVPAGPFIAGSDRAEREAAYRLDEAAYGHSATRDQRWYESEPPRHEETLPAFEIMQNPVTNRLYAMFVRQTGHRAPDVMRATWESYGLIHPFERTRPFAWVDGQPPQGRDMHPVVLVSRADAEVFADWLGSVTGRRWSLPTEAQWEKAARGIDGRYFPWGNRFDADRLNSHDKGPFSTVPVGRYPAGASPFGVRDAAGQVFEWTATSALSGRGIVKGGSWDDKGCGICRPAGRDARPIEIKHILIGFRLVTAMKNG